MHHLRKQGLLHGVSLRFHPIPDGAFGRRLRHRNKRDRYGSLVPIHHLQQQGLSKARIIICSLILTCKLSKMGINNLYLFIFLVVPCRWYFSIPLPSQSQHTYLHYPHSASHPLPSNARGLPYMTSAVGGGSGVPKKQTKGTKSVDLFM